MSDLNKIGLGDLNNLPKGMEIPLINPTQPQQIKENVKLRDLNYVNIILEKVRECKDLDIEVENLTVNETQNTSNLLLNLKIFKREV